MSLNLVIDNGAYELKCGLSGDFAPSVSFKSIIGRHILSKTYTQTYRGKDIDRMPKQGVVTPIFTNDYNNIDIDGLENLYKYALFDKIQVNDNVDEETLRNHDVTYNYLIINKPYVSDNNKIKMLELLSEKLNGKGVYFGDSTTCGMYSYGKTSGVVVDLGYKTSVVNCIYEGYNMPLSSQKVNYGGYHISELLKAQLIETNKEILTKNNISLKEIETIKRKFCYISQDYFDEILLNNHPNAAISYTLPDGKNIYIGVEKFKSSQLLFDPKLMITENEKVSNEENLPNIIINAISKSNRHYHKELYGNICLIGGNSMILGLKNSLYKGITHLAPASIDIQVHSTPQRNYAAFTGGSILANQSAMEENWITKETIKEFGYSAIKVRCF